MELDPRIVDTMYKINAEWKRCGVHFSKMVVYLDELGFSYMGLRRIAYSTDFLGNYYEIQAFHNPNSLFKDYFLFLVTRFENDSSHKFITKSLAFFMVAASCDLDFMYKKALETFREITYFGPKIAIYNVCHNTVIFDDVENVKLVEETTKFVHECDDSTQFIYQGNVYLGKLTSDDFKTIVFIEDKKTEKMYHLLSDNNFKNLMPLYKHNKVLFFKHCVRRLCFLCHHGQD